jgi:hypothetical protein
LAALPLQYKQGKASNSIKNVINFQYYLFFENIFPKKPRGSQGDRYLGSFFRLGHGTCGLFLNCADYRRVKMTIMCGTICETRLIGGGTCHQYKKE